MEVFSNGHTTELLPAVQQRRALALPLLVAPLLHLLPDGDLLPHPPVLVLVPPVLLLLLAVVQVALLLRWLPPTFGQGRYRHRPRVRRINSHLRLRHRPDLRVPGPVKAEVLRKMRVLAAD